MKKVLISFSILLFVILLTACQQSVDITINFDANNGDEIISKNFEESSTFSMPTNPTREGFVFDGWFWDDTSFQDPFTIESILDQPLQDSLTVYAKWRVIQEEPSEPEEPNESEKPSESEEDNNIMINLSLMNQQGEIITIIEKPYGTEIINLDEYSTKNNLEFDWVRTMNSPPIKFPLVLSENITLTGIGYSADLEYMPYRNGYEVSKGLNNDDNVIIPNYHNGKPVLKITDYGFQSSLIYKVNIPSNVETIGVRAFESSFLLEKIEFAETSNLKQIQLDAFAWNESLKEVKLPNGIERLEQGVFYNSNRMESITIPKTVRYIGPYVLTHNQRLKDILVDNDNSYYVSLDGVLYTKNFQTLLVYPSGLESSSYEINPQTKVINDHAFDGAKIETLYLHENLEEIRSINFVGSQLSEIIFPKNINTSLKTFDNSFHNFSNDLSIYVNGEYYNSLDEINSTSVFNQDIPIKDITSRILKSEHVKFNLLKNS